jgi:hypothetical protein
VDVPHAARFPAQAVPGRIGATNWQNANFQKQWSKTLSLVYPAQETCDSESWKEPNSKRAFIIFDFSEITSGTSQVKITNS